MTHTNIHLHADDVVSTSELPTTRPCDCVRITDAISVFVGASNAAVILQLAQLLRAAALKHGATETVADLMGDEQRARA